MSEPQPLPYRLALLLPVYRHFPEKLLNEAYRQMGDLEFPTAIYILDDGSPEPLPELERWSGKRENTYFHRRTPNSGRSAARNYLASWAQAEYLHFLDDQLLVTSPEFWAQLWEQRLPLGVVFGAAYPPDAPAPGTELRWKVARWREFGSFPPADPYASFKSGHFLAHHSVLQKVQFDEALTGYGHEDTLLGLALKEKKIPLEGLDLPVYNAHLDTNSAFLEKVEQSLHNLLFIAHRYPYYISYFRLLRLLRFLQRWQVAGLLQVLLAPGQKWMRQHLQGTNPSLRVFDLYRLSLLLSAQRSVSKRR